MSNRTFALCVALTVADEAGDTDATPLLLAAEITVDAFGAVGTITFPNVLPMPLDLVMQDAIRALRFDEYLPHSTAADDAAHFDWVISVAIDADGDVRTEKLLSASALQIPADAAALLDGWPGVAQPAGGRSGLLAV
jgi:hypothetical protein